MKIDTVTLYRVKVPMVASLTTSFGTIADKDVVLVKVTTSDGVVGWGEGAALPFPFYKPDTTATTYLALKEYLIPLVLKKAFATPADLYAAFAPVKGHAFAKCALDYAAWGIYAQERGESLSKVLGGTRGTIAVGESVSIMESIDATLAHIEHAREKGYVRMKIKIKPGWDVQVIDAIRNRFGAIDLMVDGNSAYTLEHVSVFKELDKYDLTMVEQPLADDDIIDHATLQKQITTSVCLDESVLSAEDARKAIEIGACKIINIKPGRVGGLTESKKIHDVAQEHGIGVWCGGMLETGIGRAYNIASASLPNYVYPADMSPVHEFYADDLVSPSFVVESNGHVSVPTVAGIGFDVLEEKVNTYTITSETFT